MNIISKKCSVCKKEKPLEEFNKQKLGKHGRRASCKICQNAWNKEWKQTESGIDSRKRYKKSEKGKESSKRYRESHKEEIKAYCSTDEYRRRHRLYADKQRFGGNRAEVLKRDDNKCTRCGSKYLVQVHHIDGNGRNKSKEEQNNKLDNLITLCVRCHIKEDNPIYKRWSKEPI